MFGVGSVSEGESWQVVLSLEREEGKAGPVTGGESWDSSKGVLVCSGASSEMERWSRCFADLVSQERDRRSGLLGERSLFNFRND